MSESWVFKGWVHKNGKGQLGPVPTATLRGLLSAGHLRPMDIVCKQFARNGEMCLSSPLPIELALRNEDPEDNLKSETARER
jgi:hypothetical protein